MVCGFGALRTAQPPGHNIYVAAGRAVRVRTPHPKHILVTIFHSTLQ